MVRRTKTQHGAITIAYRKSVRVKLLFLAGIAWLSVTLAVYALTQGAYGLTPLAVLRSIFGHATRITDVVVWNIRLPRIVAALVAGWALSLAGLSLQSLLKNPLASPSTLGISHGAAFGAAFSVVILNAGIVAVTCSAFAGAMLATLVIILLSRLRRLTPEAVILSGVALGSLFLAGTILVQYFATETELARVVFWTFGDVARSNWRQIGTLTLAVAAVCLYLITLRWDLNALESGDEAARGLGVAVARIRVRGMAAAALVAALVTAFHGVIAFLGLIAPHMARRLVGGDHGLLIPCSALLGGLLLLAADTLGRLLVGSGALPVGVITSFMGAPMFIYLLMREYR